MPYRFEHNRSYNLNDKKYNYKENITDGEKGLEFTLLKKEGDKFYKIKVKETSKDSFDLTEKVGDKETSKVIDIKKLKKMLKSNKDLEFAKNYVENDRGKYKGIEDALLSEELAGGKKKTTKKASKKVSKKKKVSRKKLSKKC